MKIRIGISACLLGQKTRYDGGHQFDDLLADTFGGFVEWVPICPEVEYGLPVPREKMRLEGDPGMPRLVTIESRFDHTDGMKNWASTKVEQLEKLNPRGFIFKGRSPSCGLREVKVYGPDGEMSQGGEGIFAKVFIERFLLIPVEDDERLRDQAVMDNFIKAINGQVR